MLLFERYWPGMGWLQVLLMALYSAFLAGRFAVPADAVNWRPRIWRLFSLVFFAQFFLGLAGFEKLLMTGKLHLPVPAFIIAGPLYRGSDFFMPILFTVTALLVGPAWCSYLCYVGVWDDWFSRSRSEPIQLPAYAPTIRIILLLFVIVMALILRYLKVGWFVALSAGALFGLFGVAIMAALSRRNGVMIHCTCYCPMGLIGNWLGRLSLFRIKIGDSCTECNLCRTSCRYNALSPSDIKLRRPGSTCTLCGDCIAACHSGQIGYRLPFLFTQSARAAFLVLIISLHAIFLAVARI
ncbi:MAG: hypothetical protein CVV42_04805 [Candidatus Riflebacteria bacterium HGW-Riflebacteria-2]|nr:MAG: hypothetical protein CVV42_04805 [Candidatus Riflebacteria bacterium HGW-Riflebacteria-2]